MTTEARWPMLLCAVIAVVLTWWSASLIAAVWGGYDTRAVMALDDAFLTGTDAAVIDRLNTGRGSKRLASRRLSVRLVGVRRSRGSPEA